MNSFRFLDKLPQTVYCERNISSSFLAEPINALTNLAFPFLAFVVDRRLRKHGVKDKQLLILPWLLGAVGIESFMYHTARNSVTLLFDAIPIYILILYLMYLVVKRLVNSSYKSVTILTVFLLFQISMTIIIPADFLNGSIRHVINITAISIIGYFLYRRFGSRLLKYLLAIIGLYGLAIFFRSIDQAVCEIIPFGTHFLWHLLSATSGYVGILLVYHLYQKSELAK